jgi:hypothetical protein
MPFATFFWATLLGKSLVKVNLRAVMFVSILGGDAGSGADVARARTACARAVAAAGYVRLRRVVAAHDSCEHRGKRIPAPRSVATPSQRNPQHLLFPGSQCGLPVGEEQNWTASVMTDVLAATICRRFLMQLMLGGPSTSTVTPVGDTTRSCACGLSVANRQRRLRTQALWDIITRGTVGGCWTELVWLRASLPDTFKEIWSLFMMALILYFPRQHRGRLLSLA